MRKFIFIVLILLTAALVCTVAISLNTGTAYADEQVDAINLVLSGQTFEGMCWQTGGNNWPFKIRLRRIDNRRLDGEIEWPTLGSIHRIEGEYGYGYVVFTEVSAIKKGGAYLNCVYRMSFNRNYNTMGGTWRHEGGTEAGTASFSLGPKNLNWSGTWVASWGKVYLTQTGNRVTGTYTHRGGRIEGTVNGAVFSGRWSMAPSYTESKEAGPITLTMSPDGRKFSGYWKYGGTQNGGTWEATRQ